MPAPSEPAVTLHTVCGLEELAGHGTRGISHVLSLLDPGTPEPAAFSAYGPHRRTTLHFHDCLGPGTGPGGPLVPPEPEHVAEILAFGRDLDGAAHLLVHCHYGLSRSTAALLMLLAQAEPGVGAEALVARLHALREPAWPNARMIGFADGMLGRDGTLSAAVRGLHALQLQVRPHLADVLRGLGRGAEVEAALAEPATSPPG
ncbi:protein-tyrosine-phosphatase [Methylobacterium sp. NEAU 140]|uniref:tyrosine phosphatase family protein n=1 Tax=Methylobacterium sp. NEAU 140 TaxID=3064945 RepID=UPI0027336653|nr:protein-tyrosine-phosphatase [Methylobacterium sp. NEAU 140]MDP4025382.1 protein-tyrosine-phosphatase [Methylobacterium sp. NEAU 140]